MTTTIYIGKETMKWGAQIYKYIEGKLDNA